MAKKRSVKAKRVPKGMPIIPAATAVSMSLPPSTDTSLATTVPSSTPAVKRDRTILPQRSLIRQKAMAIIALRLGGKTSEEIAAELHISEKSIRQYMWLAGKNGWLKKNAVDPTDRLEYEVAHKVVRNLDEMLDSTNESRRDIATLKTAEGMLFKRYGQDGAIPMPSTVLAIKIEMPTGPPVPIREGTTGGVARWTEGEVIDVGKSS